MYILDELLEILNNNKRFMFNFNKNISEILVTANINSQSILHFVVCALFLCINKVIQEINQYINFYFLLRTLKYNIILVYITIFCVLGV